jgi:hypothetical protein
VDGILNDLLQASTQLFPRRGKISVAFFSGSENK